MRNRMLFFVISSALLLLMVGVAYAAANGYSIDWWTVDGGGGTSQGGEYTLTGTIGQPDAGPLMSGGDNTLVGGFWGGAITPPGYAQSYLPLVLR